jgi:hypothetical protein
MSQNSVNQYNPPPKYYETSNPAEEPADFYADDPSVEEGSIEEQYGLGDDLASEDIPADEFVATSPEGEGEEDPFSVDGPQSEEFGDEFFADLEGSVAGEGSDVEALTGRIDELLQTLQESSNISAEEKDRLRAQLEELKAPLSLGPDEDKIYEIEEQLDALKGQIEDLAQYPPAVNRLAQVLEMDPEAVAKLLEKHEIDPNDPPSVNSQAIEDLLNDPELASVAEAAQKVKTARGALEEYIDLNKQQATAENNSREADTSNYTDSKDVTVFKNLWNASKHTDDASQNYMSKQENLGEAIGSVLGALYGEEVDVKKDSDTQSGVIKIGSKRARFNVGPDGELEYSSSKDLEWPEVHLVEWHFDAEGSGNLGRPQWVKDAGYPAKPYDGSGGTHST